MEKPTNMTYEFAAGAQAFGDGAHPTTRGVLEALLLIDPEAFAPRMACDVGAGSGIIGFAIIERFGCPVVAVDVAASAVATLKENAARNGVESLLMVAQADGFAHPDIVARAPYDLITINILAEPVRRLGAEAERLLANGGVVIVSGILLAQEALIVQAYQSLGLELTARLVIEEWVTLVWQKP
jgi:ribosomal protein L11 methyltransferase